MRSLLFFCISLLIFSGLTPLKGSTTAAPAASVFSTDSALSDLPPPTDKPIIWIVLQGDTCYAIKRVYVQSHWEMDAQGRRHYVPGQWVRRKVPVPCPDQAPTQSSAGCSQTTLGDAHFQRLYETIAARSFEMSKMTLALELVQTNCLNSSQVRAVVLLFKYEESRLRIATAAYPNTVDKPNYRLVREALRFQISREKLDGYIRAQHHSGERQRAPIRRGY